MLAGRPACGLFCTPGQGFSRQVSDNCAVNRRRMQILYSGNVQGVGFRYTVKSTATGFEVTGTVRNLPDGRVELVAEGERSELEEYRKAIQDSELGHFIRQEDARWDEASGGFRGFERSEEHTS